MTAAQAFFSIAAGRSVSLSDGGLRHKHCGVYEHFFLPVVLNVVFYSLSKRCPGSRYIRLYY